MRHLLSALSVAEAQQDSLSKMIESFPFQRPEDALTAVAERAVTKAVLLHD